MILPLGKLFGIYKIKRKVVSQKTLHGNSGKMLTELDVSTVDLICMVEEKELMERL
jgi:hypothetical protein